MKRVLNRDLKERGKANKKAKLDFLKSWDIYYEKVNNKSIQHNTKNFIITKNTNLDHVLEKLFN